MHRHRLINGNERRNVLQVNTCPAAYAHLGFADAELELFERLGQHADPAVGGGLLQRQCGRVAGLERGQRLTMLVPQRLEHLRHGLRPAQDLVTRHRRRRRRRSRVTTAQLSSNQPDNIFRLCQEI